MVNPSTDILRHDRVVICPGDEGELVLLELQPGSVILPGVGQASVCLRHELGTDRLTSIPLCVALIRAQRARKRSAKLVALTSSNADGVVQGECLQGDITQSGGLQKGIICFDCKNLRQLIGQPRSRRLAAGVIPESQSARRKRILKDKLATATDLSSF